MLDRELSTPRLDQRLTHLHAVARIIVDEPDLNTLVHQLAPRIGALFGADQTVIGIINGGNIQINTLYSDDRHHLVEAHISLKESQLGRLMTSAQAFRIGQVTADLSPRPLLEERYPCQEVLTIPIVNHQNHLLGVVECRNQTAGTGFCARGQSLYRDACPSDRQRH